MRSVLIALEVVATARLEGLVGILRQVQLGSEPRFDAGGQLLRHLHVDAHHVNVGDLKQLGAAAATRSAAGIDQRADIGLARGDDAVERHGDVFEAWPWCCSRSTSPWSAATSAFAELKRALALL